VAVTQPNPLLALLYPPDKQAELATLTRDVVPLGLVCQDEATVVFVASVRDEAHRRLKELEEREETVTKPLHQAKAALHALFRPVRKPLEDLKGECNKLLDGWETYKIAQEKLAREAAKALSAAGDADAAGAVLDAAPKSEAPRSWEADVPNLDLSQVPREWLTFDWPKIKAHCKEHQKNEIIPPIPGIPFVRVGKTRAR
jgi:hypothetical protein